MSTAKRVTRLAEAAAEAAQVRNLTTDPDVVALRVERIRAQVDTLLWVGIILGLAFTMVNVQVFAAGGAPEWSLPWLVAWLLDPMLGVVLIAVLRAEQVTARYQVDTPVWARRTKWFAFIATYTMNTWQSWADGSPAGVVLHSVPPMLVFAAAETGPVLRDKLTEAVFAAAKERVVFASHPPAPSSPAVGLDLAPVRDPAPDPGVNGTPAGGSEGSPATVDLAVETAGDSPDVVPAPAALTVVRNPSDPIRDDGDPFAPGDDLGDRRGAVDTAHLSNVVADLGSIARITGRRYSRTEVRVAYGIKTDRAAIAVRTCAWSGEGHADDDGVSEGSAGVKPAAGGRR